MEQEVQRYIDARLQYVPSPFSAKDNLDWESSMLRL